MKANDASHQGQGRKVRTSGRGVIADRLVEGGVENKVATESLRARAGEERRRRRRRRRAAFQPQVNPYRQHRLIVGDLYERQGS